MDIRPIFSALRRHKTAATLIVLEIALSCAIICNALFLIGNRLERMNRVSGVDENKLITLQLAGIDKEENAAAMTKTDLATLRALPGVEAATSTNQILFGNSTWNTSVNLVKDQPQPNLSASVYLGDEQQFDTLGLKLSSGRQFNADEFIEWDTLNAANSKASIPATIITRHMAEALFPGQNPLGKSFYAWGEEPIRIVGVAERLVRARDSGDASGDYQDSMLFPVRMPYSNGRYLIRIGDPARYADIMKSAAEALRKNNPNRILIDDTTKTVAQLRDKYYLQDKAMAWLLVAVIVALLVVTALGIVGLASFWVQQRTKQIGVRRALGATRGQILRYFQTENFLLATIGIVIGMLLAFGINQLLMSKYELPRLPALYLPVGAVALWLLGQIAVFWPARRAAAVPPAVATRTV